MHSEEIDDVIYAAYKLRKKGKYEEAITLLESSFFADQTRSEFLVLIGFMYMNIGMLVVAAGYFSKYLAVNPADPIGWINKGFCVMKYSCYPDSLKYFRRGIALGYGADKELANDDFWLWYGEALMRSGFAKQALKCFIKAVEINCSDLNRAYSFLFRCAVNDHILPSTTKELPANSLVNRIKNLLGVRNILCVGDSHTAIFQACRGLDVIQTGSPTAYNLINPDQTENGLKKIQTEAKKYKPSETAIVFTYGEIDIRAHIYRHSAKNSMSFDKSTDIVVSRYLEALKIFRQSGFTVLINGPFGTGVGVPAYGSERDRNVIAALINSKLKSFCALNTGFYFASLFQVVVNEKFLTNREFVGNIDDNHLNVGHGLTFCLLSRFIDSISEKHCFFEQLPVPSGARHVYSGRMHAISWGTRSHEINNLFISSDGSLSSEKRSKDQLLLISFFEHLRLESIVLAFNGDCLFLQQKCFVELQFYDGDFVLQGSTPCQEIVSFDGCEIGASNFSDKWIWYVRIHLSGPICADELSSISVYHDRYSCFSD